MNRFKKRPQILSASLGLIALAAVVAGGPARAETPDACTLLTKAQVKAALGVAVEAGVRPIATDPRICNWRESNKPTGPGRNVMLTLITVNEFEKLKKLPMTAPVSAIGDEAVVTHSMRVPAILMVKSGTHYFRLLVRSDLQASEEVEARNQTLEKSLAAQILKKL